MLWDFENDTLAQGETAKLLEKELIPIKNSQFNDTSSNVRDFGE